MYGSKCQLNYGMGNDTFHLEAGSRIREVFNFCEPLIYDEYLIYTENKLFKDENILILGGGGSTKRWLESNPSLDYDSIWSLNNFYKNNYIYNNIKVDLFSVGPEVNVKDPILLDYLYKNNTIAAIELHQKWGRTFNNPETGQTPSQLKDEINLFYDNNKKVCFQTKFYSQLGGGVRLLIYAAHIGVKSISFIGFDGPTAILNGDHAFEKGKVQFPGAVKHLDNNTKVKFFQQQYSVFWQYFKQIYKTKVISLDDNPLHSSCR